MTELRQRMIEDMRLRGLAEGTQQVYVEAVKHFAAHDSRSPDQLTEGEVRDFILHLTETVPQELRRIVRSHPERLYGVLMKAAAQALVKLAADPHYVGGKIGILAVLHTWTRTLEYHPHVHCLVPGGGVSPDGSWSPSRPDYLVPVKALSKIFRGIFMDLACKALPNIMLPASVWKQSCLPVPQGRGDNP